MHAFMHGVTTCLAIVGALTVAASITLGVLAIVQYRRNGWNG
jgi:negative regulator of sigma E activity